MFFYGSVLFLLEMKTKKKSTQNKYFFELTKKWLKQDWHEDDKQDHDDDDDDENNVEKEDNDSYDEDELQQY